MRERDLERATEIFQNIKSLEGDYGTHDAFGKYLRVEFALPKDNGPEEYANVWTALALNQDELHARANLLIRAMLDERMINLKAELRKLGIKLESEFEQEPKPKTKKQRLLPAPPNEGTSATKNGGAK